MNFSNQELQAKNINADKNYRFLKRLLTIAVISHLFLTIFTLTSCSSDADDMDIDEQLEDPVESIVLPELILQNGSEDLVLGVFEGAANGLVNQTVKANAPEGMVSLKISRVRDGVTTEYETIAEGHPNYSSGMTSFNYQLNYIFKKDDVETDLYFIAEVLDEEGNTDSLKFGSALVKLPMIKSTFSLQASTNGVYNDFSPYYLYIKENNIEALSIPEAQTEENDKNIAAIMSFNQESQYYIASPTDVDEIALTDGLLEISTTKFKYHGISENGLNNDYTTLDTHEIEANYEEILFAEQDERIFDLEKDVRFYFKTQDDRIAILQVVKIENLGPTSIVVFDIIITQ